MKRTMMSCAVTMTLLAITTVAAAQDGDTGVESSVTEETSDDTAPAEVEAPAAKPEEEAPVKDADERTANNAIYLELGGPGLFYTVNYDRAFGDVSGRIGLGYISVTAASGGASASATFVTVPLTLSYLGLGSKTHMFEVGGGVTFFYMGAGANGFYAGDQADASASVFLPVVTTQLGYRFQPKDGGFLFRIGVSPLISSAGVLPWPYLALGGTF